MKRPDAGPPVRSPTVAPASCAMSAPPRDPTGQALARRRRRGARRRRSTGPPRRPHPADVADVGQHLGQHTGLAQTAVGLVGEPGADERRRQVVLGRREDRFAVASGTATLRRGEDVAVQRIVDHAGYDVAVALRRDRHREAREPVEVVRGAVDRVDQPPDARPPRVVGALFTHDAVVGPSGADAGHDEGLGRAVDLGHHVGRDDFVDTSTRWRSSPSSNSAAASAASVVASVSNSPARSSTATP